MDKAFAGRPAFIYGLTHPGLRDGRICFVGITGQPARTLARHRRRAGCGDLELDVLATIDSPRGDREAARIAADLAREHGAYRSARRFYGWVRFKLGLEPAAGSTQARRGATATGSAVGFFDPGDSGASTGLSYARFFGGDQLSYPSLGGGGPSNRRSRS